MILSEAKEKYISETNLAGGAKAPFTEEAPMEREKVLEKIQNLLNKTEEHGCTIEEAATAAAKVQELLTKYSLDLVDIPALENGSNGIQVDAERLDLSCRIFYREKGWRRELASDVARYNYCKALISGTHMLFIGTPENTAVVKEVVKWLIKQLDEMATQAQRDYVKKEGKWVWNARGTGDHPLSYRASWLMGAVITIRYRLYEQWSTAQAAQNEVKALVIRHETLIDDFIQEQYGPLRDVRTNHHQENWNGYSQGKAAGARVNLSPQRRLGDGGKHSLPS